MKLLGKVLLLIFSVAAPSILVTLASIIIWPTRMAGPLITLTVVATLALLTFNKKVRNRIDHYIRCI